MKAFLLALSLLGVVGCADRLQRYELDRCKFDIQYLQDRQRKQVEIMNHSPLTVEGHLAFLQYQIYYLEKQKYFEPKYEECWK